MRNNRANEPLTAEELENKRKKRHKAEKRKSVWRVIDRIFGFILATVIVVGCSCLALEYILVKGPSPALKELFVMTMFETRRFDFINRIFLTEEETREIENTNKSIHIGTTDAELISIAAKDEDVEQTNEQGMDAYGLIDDDGDGIIYVDVKGSGYVGYMIVILDPTRVFLGTPGDYSYATVGWSLEEYVQNYGAIGGINGGGFVDKDGAGLGGQPQGLTIVDGVHYGVDYSYCNFIGIDDEGVMHCGYFDSYWAGKRNIQYGVSFDPLLIVNGEPADISGILSGVNPRSAIGQRADGAIVMLAIDGRQTHSLGATYQDVIELLMSYGVVNAINLDGGSSSALYMNGQYLNKCSSQSGFSRNLPNAWLFK